MFKFIKEHQLIISLIPEKSKVLDLGCGDGSLLAQLIKEKNITGYGVDYSEEMVVRCIENGISVIQANLDLGLVDFRELSFDYVILNQTLQAVYKPDMLINEMLRVGKKCIVAFPNFAFWKIRYYLLFKGKMPVMNYLPHKWYDTPNIHHLTVKDFKLYCEKQNIKISKEIYLSRGGTRGNILPNYFAESAVFMLEKKD